MCNNIKFIPKYNEYSQTKTDNKCEYCGMTTYIRKTTNKIYKLNNKYICWNCLRKYAHKFGVSVYEFIKE